MNREHAVLPVGEGVAAEGRGVDAVGVGTEGRGVAVAVGAGMLVPVVGLTGPEAGTHW